MKKSTTPDPGHVHIWHFPLESGEISRHRHQRLDDAEQRQSTRFRLDRDRRRFEIRRIYRRLILARYAGVDPASLAFSCDQFGRPAIDSAHSTEVVHFSASHSEESGVIAVSDTRSCGIDIEHRSHASNHEGIIRNMFSQQECDDILRENAQNRDLSFLNCWTAKEAYLKALGFGLNKPLDSFAVCVAEDSAPGLQWDIDDPDAQSRWSFWRSHLLDDCIVTLAYQGDLRSVELISATERLGRFP